MGSSSVRSSALVVAMGVACLAPRTARAQPNDTSQAKPTDAAALFDEGRRLFHDGQFTEACERFAASQKLEPRSGTILNLALCHEKEGKTATAYADFQIARSMSEREHKPDREQYASERMAELLKHLSYLRFRIAPTKGAPPSVFIDDSALDTKAGMPPSPIDPGSHVVEARFPNKRAFRQEVVIDAATPATVDVNIPALEEDQPTKAQPPRTTLPPSYVPPTLWVVGAAGIGLGAAFGVQAIGQRHDAETRCQTTCDSAAHDLDAAANRSAWLANVTIGLGLAAAAAGVYVFFISQKQGGKRLVGSTQPQTGFA
jgi:hypothetical protein